MLSVYALADVAGFLSEEILEGRSNYSLMDFLEGCSLPIKEAILDEALGTLHFSIISIHSSVAMIHPHPAARQQVLLLRFLQAGFEGEGFTMLFPVFMC